VVSNNTFVPPAVPKPAAEPRKSNLISMLPDTDLEEPRRKKPGEKKPPSTQDVSSPKEDAIITQLAERWMNTCKPEVRERFAQDVHAWPAEKIEELTRLGIDPLVARFRQHAETLYKHGALGALDIPTDRNIVETPQPTTSSAPTNLPRASAGLHHFVQHYRIQKQQNKIPNGWRQSVTP
jgi:hypothetical protein